MHLYKIQFFCIIIHINYNMLHGHHAQEGIMKKNSLTKLLALTLCAVLALSLIHI